MGRTVDATVLTTPLLKREDYERTKHDSAFSNWKILIGPYDWDDYLLSKEGAERYRTHNLPNCSSCPGLYELGIVVSRSRTEGTISNELSSKNIIPVYLGQADNVRNRLQQYGRNGAHLENGWSKGEKNDRKILGLLSDVFSYGFAVAFRWAPMETKKDAEKTESQLLKTFNYAWNTGMNEERRPDDIHRKLDAYSTNIKRVNMVLKKLNIFPPKKVGLNIKHYDPPILENGSSFYTKQKDANILSRIFTFNRSRPKLVSKECDTNTNDFGTCGVALGHGSICTMSPVEGRKRCVDHKGMKVNAFIKPRFLTNEDDTCHLSCGVTLNDGSFCTSVPVVGRKRCEDHKGMRISGFAAKKVINPELAHTTCSLTCVATTLNGSVCRRKPDKDSKFCWQHEAMKAKINHSSLELDL